MCYVTEPAVSPDVIVFFLESEGESLNFRGMGDSNNPGVGGLGSVRHQYRLDPIFQCLTS